MRYINVFFIFICQSCVFIRKDDSVDLGNNYRFIQDTPQTIIYHSTYKYKGAGIEIIPPIVLSYNFDDIYIIAKSQDVDEITGSKKSKSKKYWIIDKRIKEKKIESLDSVSFYYTLKSLNINMDF